MRLSALPTRPHVPDPAIEEGRRVDSSCQYPVASPRRCDAAVGLANTVSRARPAHRGESARLLASSTDPGPGPVTEGTASTCRASATTGAPFRHQGDATRLLASPT
jgi:hypothetical protein